jgi:hypothetical protein
MTEKELYERTTAASKELSEAFNVIAKKYQGPIMPAALAIMTYDLFLSENGKIAQNLYERTMAILIQGEDNGKEA